MYLPTFIMKELDCVFSIFKALHIKVGIFWFGFHKWVEQLEHCGLLAEIVEMRWNRIDDLLADKCF